MATNVSARTTPHLRERELEAEQVVDQSTDEPVVALEREQQRDAADDRRQHHRQHDQRAHERAAGEPRRARARTRAARRTPPRRTVDHKRALEREADRVACRGLTEVVPERRSTARVGSSPISGRTKNATATRARSDRDERHSPPSTAHWSGGGRNPKLCSVFWPAGDAAYSTHAVGEVLVLRRRDAARSGRSRTRSCHAGICTAWTRRARRLGVGGVDDRRIGVTGRRPRRASPSRRRPG